MTPERLSQARAEELAAPERWAEHPPGVLRASSWYLRNLIECLCSQAQKGGVPVEPQVVPKAKP